MTRISFTFERKAGEISTETRGDIEIDGEFLGVCIEVPADGGAIRILPVIEITGRPADKTI